MQRETYIVGAVALVAGAAGGFFGAKYMYEKKFQEDLDAEVAEVKEFYAKANKAGDYATPEAAAERLGLVGEAADAIRSYQGVETPVEVVVSVEDGTTVNVFDGVTARALNIEERSHAIPYVITNEEFFQNEPEHEQVTITYYMGDDVLADDKDGVIEDVDTLIQRENLQLFGVGSEDEAIVYIRNEKKTIDFEITRSEGKYAHEVLGFTEELKHSDERRPRRPQWDD